MQVRLVTGEGRLLAGTRPVHLIITVMNWIRTSGLSIKKSLSGRRGRKRFSGAKPSAMMHVYTHVRIHVHVL